MIAQLCVLASGSSGNACFLEVGGVRVLVDDGLPLSRLARALQELGCAPADLDAVLITHEHTDHVRGLVELRAAAPELAIHATPATARAVAGVCGPVVDHATLAHGETLEIGPLRVLPFCVDHDAADPVGYRLAAGDFAVAVATDLGDDTPVIRRAMADCRALVIEANHDEDLLARGAYPPFLKRRVASRRGHLSNRQAAQLIAAVAGPRLEQVVLCHLSESNNSPERAEQAVRTALRRRHAHVEVTAAERHRPGPVMRFEVAAGIPRPVVLEPGRAVQQPRLF
jgi:phosphoribosyl 1,2-cyclic phosphodiesterase